jgi:toxin YoeB
MEITFSPKAQEDIEYWKKSGNHTIMNKITILLKDIAEHPFTGAGKPEPLKYDFSGCWSRRINSEHRIIYAVRKQENECDIKKKRYLLLGYLSFFMITNYPEQGSKHLFFYTEYYFFH